MGNGPDGYAFEKAVANELRALGYPVFYQNLKMRLHGLTFIEFDIVSLDFIIEVKAGKSIKTCGIDTLYALGRLPANFMIYIYCAALTDEQIAEQNDSSLRNLRYINDLRHVVAAHPPRNICNIRSAKNLNRFLRIPYEMLRSFDVIYVEKSVFEHIYYSLHHIKDWYSKYDGTKRSDKIRSLLEEGRIVFVDEFNPHVPDFNRYYLGGGVMNLKELGNIIIPLVYHYTAYAQYHEDCVDIPPPMRECIS